MALTADVSAPVCLFFSSVPKPQTAMCVCSHYHHHLGAVSLVMHKRKACRINTLAVVLEKWRKGAKRA